MTREEEIKEAAVSFCRVEEAPDGFAFIPQSSFVVGALWADEHPHWISIADELPPKKSEYDDLSNNVLATDGKEIYESVYNHDFEDWFTHDMWGLDNITHWMPLPKMPILSKSSNTGKYLKGGEE
jgi:hypothetical protein